MRTQRGTACRSEGPLRPSKPGTTTPVLKICPIRPIVPRQSPRNNTVSGWGLCCGDDGSRRSRATPPNPSKPRLLAHPDPVSRLGFLASIPRDWLCLESFLKLFLMLFGKLSGNSFGNPFAFCIVPIESTALIPRANVPGICERTATHAEDPQS